MGNAFLYFQLVCDDDNEEEEDLPAPQGLNKREKPTPMQEGPSGEEDLPEIRCLKGRPTPTQAASMRSHAEVVIVDDVSEPAASSRWSDTTQYRWVYLYTASLPLLQTDYLLSL